MNISVKGIVQGVGFRPFVQRLASGMGLCGYVTNTADGVEITAEGEGLADFLERLKKEAPPLSRILSVEVSVSDPVGFEGFEIRSSLEKGRFTLLSADIASCGECLREMLDTSDRRYHYPFINCTNCGPRYSITRFVPYDRPNTTMDVFKMCSRCRAEYDDPADRRFHAQPNACPECGPKIWLVDASGALLETADPLEKTRALLKEGRIVAIRGLGGFHLACDAMNAGAVEELRRRKRRSNKPFAVMVPHAEMAERFCEMDQEERSLLESHQRPIVLLKRNNSCGLPEAVSPHNPYIGVMLPYTPLHHLLVASPPLRGGSPQATRRGEDEGEGDGLCRLGALVMTSGNLSEEPLVTDNFEALSKLAGIADAFLLHDREIFMRVDDSVLRLRSHRSRKAVSFIRRSRGYVPEPIVLMDEGPEVMGCGADLKNTFTLTKGSYAVMSQHIGDMENYETLRFYEETFRNLKAVYRVEPVALAHDLHPGYLSTRWAEQQSCRLFGIQHHYAHIGSVMAEKGLTEKVIGVAFDGNGFGEDGSLWGGEFLIADISGFKRAAHLSPVALPGGEQAIREPWRTTVSQLRSATGPQIFEYLEAAGFIEKYGRKRLQEILLIADKKEFSPLSSGAGRFFDAAAALIGVCDHNTFEGEAAAALEAVIAKEVTDSYPVDIILGEKIEIDLNMTFLAIISDITRGTPPGVMSARFHNSMISAVVNVAARLASVHNLQKVVLSGGVFQNSCLLSGVTEGLASESLKVYTNELVPCNDAGISLGQAYIIRERLKKGEG